MPIFFGFKQVTGFIETVNISSVLIAIVSSGGSGESAHMHRLARAIASRIKRTGVDEVSGQTLKL